MEKTNSTPSESYASVFNSNVADIDFMDIIKRSDPVLVNLSALKAIRLNEDMIKHLATFLSPFFRLSPCDQKKVIFSGNAQDVEVLLEHIPCARHTFLSNPSILSILSEVDV